MLNRTGRSASSLVAKKASNLVTKTPSASSTLKDCASGSPLFLHLQRWAPARMFPVLTHSVPDVLLVVLSSLIFWVMILAFLTATIVSWTVSRNPCDVKLSTEVDVASWFISFWASLVNLNCLVPEVNRGIPEVFGLGILNAPPTNPVTSERSLIRVIVAWAPLDSPVRTISAFAHPR